MADKMHEWITTGERELPAFLSPFAKSASGGKSRDEDAAEQVEAIITKAGVSISNLNAVDIARAVNDDAANRMRT